MDFIKRLFGKNTRPEPITSRALLKEVRSLLDKTREVSRIDISSTKFVSNPLVDASVMESKVGELSFAMKQAILGLENVEEFLLCLHNWQTTPPPLPKKPVANEDLPIADTDQEFLDKLEEAKNAGK